MTGENARTHPSVIPIPGRWKPDVPLFLPKAGVSAHGQAEIVARAIAAEIAGTGGQGDFTGAGLLYARGGREAGESLAGFACGDFFATPSPRVELGQLGRTWHLGKVLFENWWLAPHGQKREAWRRALQVGSRG